jgi:hypothetical protein
VGLEPEQFATFVPADPPRAGALVVWGDGQGPDELDLVLPVGGGVRRRRVRGRLLPLGSALPALLAPAAGGASASVAAWSAAAATGVGLVARGRLLPVASPDGYAAWRVGPLDAADLDWLRRLAAAMPPQAHALAVEGRRPLRLRSPEGLVRELWDAIADTLVRTPAAVHASGAGAFAAVEPVPVGELAGWLAETDRGLDAGAQVQLRIELPVKEEEPFAAVVQVRSMADPSLVVDAGELWRAPAVVLARLGERAETDLLLALRRGARAWPPLAPLLRTAAPTEVSLDEEQVAELLETGAETLGGAGIEVLWPAELLGEGLEVRATVATPAPAGAAAPVFRLQALLDFDWRVTVGGEALTAEEVAALAEAKRPLVRLRGRWVRVNRELLERLRRRRGPRISAAEALAAALTGTLGLGGCLADDMGLGKTVQVIALHLHRRPLEAGPTLVVCPTSLLGNWQRELARFAPEVPVRRYHGGGRHLERLAADEVVLVTYGVVRRDRAVLAEVGWGLVVADEAQHAKNPLSRTARELRAIPAPARVALTGTPVENRLTELWSILDWTTPGLLGPLERFRRSVAVPVERHRDPDATERLARVVRPFLLRRRKSDPRIAPELPAKTETDRVVPLTAEQATLYEAVVRETLAKIASSEGLERRGLVLGLLTALKQICNHPAQYLHEAAPLGGRSGKLAALEELLEIILDEGEAALVFSQYVEMCRLIQAHLADRGVPTLFLHGRVPARRREELVARFQDGGAPVFLLSLKAGGVGLNLTRATHVVHYDRWWNPAVEDQATDRAYRIGQDRPVQVHRLVTEGTLEDRIAALLASKRGLAEAVVGAGEAWITELSDAELAELVSLQATP